MKRKRRRILCIIIVVLLLSPLFPYIRSLAVMGVYSGIHERKSIMAERGFTLEIPGGLSTVETDWYPFVMTYNDNGGFAKHADAPGVKLTVLYNFPAFSLRQGCSRLYDVESPYYNGFYGAYLLTGKISSADGTLVPYGFLADGSVDEKAVARVAEYDFYKLVLNDLGLPARKKDFQWRVTDEKYGVTMAGSEGWTRTDAELVVNGTAHENTGFHRSYLQYGAPGYETSEADSFAAVTMYGRIYARYLEEYDTSLFFYVIAADTDVVEGCDEKILQRSRLCDRIT